MNNTTNLSSFPTSIDTFERMSDISGKPIADGEQSTLEKSKIYKEIIEAGNYEDAEKYLKENEDLAKCAINASMVNKHSDAIVAIEENVIKNKETLAQMNEGLTYLNNKTESIHSKLIENNSTSNSVYLNTILNNSIKSSLKIKGDKYVSVSCNQDDLNISLKKQYINEGKILYLNEYYNEHQIFELLMQQNITLSDAGNNTASGQANIELNSSAYDLSIDSTTIKIIDVSGYIETPGYLNTPYTCYPLNVSNKVEMYWSNSISRNSPEVPNGQNPRIYLNINNIFIPPNSPKIIQAYLIIKFITI